MRTWIGVGILVLLLGIGIFFTAYTADTQNRIAQTLFESREAAAVGQWEKAAGKCYQARASGKNTKSSPPPWWITSPWRKWMPCLPSWKCI